MLGFLRIFSVISLLIVIALAIAGGMLFRNAAEEDAVELIQKNNAIMARGYIETVWNKYGYAILPLADDPSKLRADDPVVAEFARETARFFKQMPLMRVNIYSPRGLLLMTVGAAMPETLAGNASSPDSGYIQGKIKQGAEGIHLLPDVSLNGQPHATLVQAVAPMHLPALAGKPPILSAGTLESLYDITGIRAKMKNFQWMGTGGIILLFVLFLGMLFLVSRKAESIIAKQHEANQELIEAAETAQAESREKSQFLANVSHELRTPLNAIIGFSDILKNELMPTINDKKYENYVTDINASGIHLLSLINDILDYSKAEAGKLELEVSEINVNKTVQNCLRLVSPRAEAAQVQLIEDLPKEQLSMVTDSKKFKQVLLNLLSNAVKFTPPDGKVRVTAWNNIKDDSFSFEVSDTGIGIAPKDISRAMAPFGQVDNTLKRKYDGTGLGLPLTKKFVELLGGKFIIESELNVGTKITFTLPREIKPREDLVIKPADAEAAPQPAAA